MQNLKLPRQNALIFNTCIYWFSFSFLFYTHWFYIDCCFLSSFTYLIINYTAWSNDKIARWDWSLGPLDLETFALLLDHGASSSVLILQTLCSQLKKLAGTLNSSLFIFTQRTFGVCLCMFDRWFFLFSEMAKFQKRKLVAYLSVVWDIFFLKCKHFAAPFTFDQGCRI